MGTKRYWGLLILLGLQGCHSNRLFEDLEKAIAGNHISEPQFQVRRIFVTNGSYSGDVGGIAGADDKCRVDVYNPDGVGNGNWKAMVVGMGRIACSTPNCSGGAAEHVDWVLKPNTRYIRPDGTLIGTTAALGLLPLPLNQPIAAVSGYVWTGLGANWLLSNNCSDWTNNTSSQGNYGISEEIDIQAIGTYNSTCNASCRFYCVEQ